MYIIANKENADAAIRDGNSYWHEKEGWVALDYCTRWTADHANGTVSVPDFPEGGWWMEEPNPFRITPDDDAGDTMAERFQTARDALIVLRAELVKARAELVTVGVELVTARDERDKVSAYSREVLHDLERVQKRLKEHTNFRDDLAIWLSPALNIPDEDAIREIVESVIADADADETLDEERITEIVSEMLEGAVVTIVA